MDETASQLRTALYGQHNDGHKRLDTSALVRHCQKEMLKAASLDNTFQPHHNDISCILPVEGMLPNNNILMTDEDGEHYSDYETTDDDAEPLQ